MCSLNHNIRTQSARRSWLGVWLALLLPLLAGCPAAEESQTDANGVARDDRPAAGDWISPNEVQYYLNDSIVVDYRLEHNDPTSSAWIAMVPVDTESLLAGDNFAAQVEYTHIYDLPQGTAKFHARKNGEYILRLFAAKRDDSEMIAQSEVLRIGTPAEELRQLTPPYVTLSGFDLPEEIVLLPGMVIAVYWELEEPAGPDAWLGMVPTSVSSESAIDNLAAALEKHKLDGQTKSFSRFRLQQAGEFVFRLFASNGPEQSLICESEVFIVSAEPPTGE